MFVKLFNINYEKAYYVKKNESDAHGIFGYFGAIFYLQCCT